MGVLHTCHPGSESAHASRMPQSGLNLYHCALETAHCARIFNSVKTIGQVHTRSFWTACMVHTMCCMTAEEVQLAAQQHQSHPPASSILSMLHTVCCSF